MEEKLNDMATVLNQIAAEISHLTWNIALYNFAITALLLQIITNTKESNKIMKLYELLNLTLPTTAISLLIVEKDGNSSYFSGIVSYVPTTYCEYTINDLTTENDMLLVSIEDKR